jgi:hypothetical protein
VGGQFLYSTTTMSSKPHLVLTLHLEFRANRSKEKSVF